MSEYKKQASYTILLLSTILLLHTLNCQIQKIGEFALMSDKNSNFSLDILNWT